MPEMTKDDFKAEELAMAHGISSLPSLVLYQNGKIVKQAAGAKPLAALED